MTREEAIKWFRESPFWHKDHVPFNMAIQALEQEPCEDAVSRKALISHIEKQSREWGEDYDAQQILGDIEDMPSVKPQLCEDVISKRAVNILVDELARAISDERCCMSRGRSTATIMQDILDLPSVKPQEKTGHWIVKKDCEGKTRKCICDKCGYETGKYTWKNPNYCAECGAKMEVEQNG